LGAEAALGVSLSGCSFVGDGGEADRRVHREEISTYSRPTFVSEAVWEGPKKYVLLKAALPCGAKLVMASAPGSVVTMEENNGPWKAVKSA
jgi:hypothetical protein